MFTLNKNNANDLHGLKIAKPQARDLQNCHQKQWLTLQQTEDQTLCAPESPA